MNTFIRFFMMLVLCIAMTGCASHQHELDVSSDPDHLVSGHMEHGGTGSPDMLVVEMKGKKYEGELIVRRYLDRAKVRKVYGSDSKHWQRITSGLDRDHHSSEGEAEIKSVDGDSMQCRLLWSRSDKPQGECLDQAGESHPIVFHR